MRVATRRVLLLAAGCTVLAAAVAAPRALRTVEAFRVRRVEVVGTRHLAPHEVLAASGIGRESSLFDDPELWREPLLAHPLIADVQVERRLPGTVTLLVHELQPVALVRTPELRVADRVGRVLPIDPTAAALDLPVVGVSSAVDAYGRLDSRLAVELVRKLDRLREVDPAMAERVSEAQPIEGGIRLVLREPAAVEALLPAEIDALRLRRLHRVLTDLAQRGELDGVHRIDARFHDQIVVSMTPRIQS